MPLRGHSPCHKERHMPYGIRKGGKSGNRTGVLRNVQSVAAQWIAKF